MVVVIDWVVVSKVALQLVQLADKLWKARPRATNPAPIDAAHAKVQAALRALLDPSREPDLDRIRAIATEAAAVLGHDDDGVRAVHQIASNVEAAKRAPRRKAAKKKAGWTGSRRINGGSKKKASRRKSSRRKK